MDVTTVADDLVVIHDGIRVNRFDGRRAHALLKRQVNRYGWRPAGSA